MKSIKNLLLFLTAIIGLVPVNSSAKDFVYEGITYTVIDEDARTCQTKEGSGSGNGAGNNVTGNVILPEHPMDGSTKYTLTVIAKYSFCRLNDLTGISIPNSVTKIDDYAFHCCHNLIELKLSDSLDSIGVLAFGACYSLNEISLPNSVTTLGKDCFGSCNSVEKLVIPESIKEISYGAFNSCNGLQTVEMPASVTKICRRAFANCISLTDITMSGVEIIEESVFEGCTALTELTLPDNITTISSNTFKDCTSLTNIYLPKYLNSIESKAFKGCEKLTDIFLPDLLKSIGRESFWGCNALTKISIPKSVTTLEPDAFRLCSNLQELVIEDGETNLLLPYSSIDTQELNYSFADTSLQKVYIGRNLEITQPSYGTSPFFYCRTINKVQFGDNVNSVPDCLFWASDSLEDIEFSESIKRIGKHSFHGCVSLKKINLPPFLEKIDDYAFSNIKLDHIYYNTLIPAELKYDGFDQWIYDNTVLEMPKTILDNIDSFSSWNNFKNKLPIAILATSLELKITELSLLIGETMQIEAIIMPADATDKTIIWTSDNETVATVDEEGYVTALSCGSAVITALCGELSAKCSVNIEEIPSIMCSSLTLNHSDVTLYFGKAIELNAEILPENATNKKVEWISSDPSIAMVDSSGFVTAVGIINGEVINGEVIITARTVDGSNLEASCKVNVIPKPVTSVDLSITSWTGNVGDKISITAIAKPDDADINMINWGIEGDSNVVTFDFDSEHNGRIGQATAKLTAKSIGQVTVWASAGYPIVSSSCLITVEPRFVESINLSQETVQLKVGESVQLIATVLPEDATDKTVVWKSENESIATVDEDGNITALSLGEAIITASCGEVHASCNVTVVASDPIMCTSLTLNETEAVLMIGKCIELKAFVMPEDASNKIIQWESSNPMIAEVSSDGIVTAIGIEIGEVLITARTTDGSNLETVCRVLVEPNPVLSVELSMDSWTCHVGDEISITAIAKPDDADFNEIKWSVDGISDVVEYVFDWNADLGNRGQSTIKLRAKSTGVATLTAYAGYPNSVSATCSITVEPIYVEDIILSQETAQLKVGESVQLTATVLPDNAIDKTVIWKSEKLDVATVDENGKVTAVSLGEATITAICGEVKAECNVIVVLTPVESIELSQETADLKVGESVQLTATVLPDNATDKTVVWNSGNESVATVDENGKITALSLGEATITAICGEVKAECKVIVVLTPVESIELSQETADLKVGESVQLTATVLPDDATDKTVIWKSENVDVATVDRDGKVLAVSIGDAVITASCGNVNSSCRVTVLSTPVESIKLSQETAKLKVGESVQLTATVLPDDATDKTIVWSSDNSDVATVSDNGFITAASIGEAEIKAVCGDVFASCIIKVMPILAESLSISPEMWNGDKDESFLISAVVLPENTTNKALEYDSSDFNIAKVNDEGLVTVVGIGSCVIKVSTTDGSNLSAECVVTGVSGVESLLGDSKENIDVYDTHGFLLKKNCTLDSLKQLTPGIYILHSGNTVKTIYLNGGL